MFVLKTFHNCLNQNAQEKIYLKRFNMFKMSFTKN